MGKRIGSPEHSTLHGARRERGQAQAPARPTQERGTHLANKGTQRDVRQEALANGK